MRNLSLGAAQIGFEYGVANKTGKPNQKTIFEILDAAKRFEIEWIQTSPEYGDSEKAIGEYLSGTSSGFKVISKFAADVDFSKPQSVLDSLLKSQGRVGPKLRGAFLNDPVLLHQWDRMILPVLDMCYENGVIETAGVSLYSAHELEVAARIDSLDMIQLPFNVFNREVLNSKSLNFAIDSGKTIYVRSVFLQGLLLLRPDELPAHLKGAANWISDWREICHRFGLAPREAAMKYVQARMPSGNLILGAESPSQIEENVATYDSSAVPPEFVHEVEKLLVPERIYDPRKWGRP